MLEETKGRVDHRLRPANTYRVIACVWHGAEPPPKRVEHRPAFAFPGRTRLLDGHPRSEAGQSGGELAQLSRREEVRLAPHPEYETDGASVTSGSQLAEHGEN